jgi:uncharacterized protein (TIGR00304 family)
MRLIHIAYLLILGGFVTIILAAINGEASFGLFLIFPFIYGSGALSLLGVVLIIIGILLLFISPMHEISKIPTYNEFPEEEYIVEKPQKKTKFGGVVLIGPVPIVFGSDKNMAMLSVITAILIILSFTLIFLFL